MGGYVEAVRPPRLHALGLGAFGARVLTAIAPRPGITPLAWLTVLQGQQRVCASEMLFLVADWDETGSARLAAQLARGAHACGCLTVAIGTLPCVCAGAHRARHAQRHLALVRPWAHVVWTIPPAHVRQRGTCHPGWHRALAHADTLARQGVEGLTDLLRPGLIGLDFADVAAACALPGDLLVGLGEATGPQRAIMAARQALASPWIDPARLRQVRAVLLTVLGSPDMTLDEPHLAASTVLTAMPQQPSFIFAGLPERRLHPTIRVTLVAAGHAAPA
jgi:cell division protein FtsZ